MQQVYFHGTSGAYADAILAQGFAVDAARRSDPGDFGWGIYLTRRRERAISYGPTVLRVVVDDSHLAFIKNPYFIEPGRNPNPTRGRAGPFGRETTPTTPEEMLFYGIAFDAQGEMLTVHHAADRVAVARLVRDTFLLNGFQGIRTGSRDGETVIFDVAAVLEVTRA